jgi:hypothetical protein
VIASTANLGRRRLTRDEGGAILRLKNFNLLPYIGTIRTANVFIAKKLEEYCPNMTVSLDSARVRHRRTPCDSGAVVTVVF